METKKGSGREALVSQMVLTAAAPPPLVLSDLAATLPPDVRLQDLTLSYGGTLEVEMRVAARRAVAYDQFLSRLGESRRFENVVPGAENRDGEVLATVRATYRAEP